MTVVSLFEFACIHSFNSWVILVLVDGKYNVMYVYMFVFIIICVEGCVVD